MQRKDSIGLFNCPAGYGKKMIEKLTSSKRKKAKTSQASLLPDTSCLLAFHQNELGMFSRRRKERNAYRQVVSLVPVYLLQFCYGMNTGFPAILTPQLQEPCSELQITSDQESWIVSLDNLLSPLVCICSGFLQHKFGPLRILTFSCFPYIFGWLTAALAYKVEHIYLSRLFVGFSHAFISTSIYTVEISSKEFRGSFSVLESVLRSLGAITVYILGLFFRWWEIASLATMVPVFALMASLLLSDESPVYLVNRGKLEEAKNSISRVFGPEFNSEAEVNLIRDNLEELKQVTDTDQWKIWAVHKRPEVYKPFLIIITLGLVQQFSGVSVIRAYVVKIFNEVFSVLSNENSPNKTLGIQISECNEESKTSTMAYISAMMIGLCRLLSSLTLARLLRDFPRRSMYAVSLMITSISLISFSLFSFLLPSSHLLYPTYITGIKAGCLISVCLLVFSVQLGVQTLPLLLSGELFPADVRASCKSLTRSVICIFLIITIKLYPLLEAQFSMSGTFLIFGVAVLLFSPVVYFTVPETKDLNLEMIQQYFTPQKTVWYMSVEEYGHN